MKTLFYFSILTQLVLSTNAFRYIGWYLGDETGIDNIPFDIYTHIVTGFPIIYDNGTVACNKSDTVLQTIVNRSKEHGSLVQWRYGGPPVQDILWNSSNFYKRDNYLNSIGNALTECNIDGIEVDFEWRDTKWRWGLVPYKDATIYTNFLKDLKTAVGPDRVVSADVGVWGLPQEYIIDFLPWINVDMLNRGDFDFINTMSYYWEKDGNIWSWKKDWYVLHKVWGIDMERINLGIPYYSMNYSEFKIAGEPVWTELSKKCPNIDPSVNVCDDLLIIGKEMNYNIGKFAAERSFGGLFPWAMSYDSFENNNTMITWAKRGVENVVPVGS